MDKLYRLICTWHEIQNANGTKQSGYRPSGPHSVTDSVSPNKGVGLSVNINMYVYVYTCFSRHNFLESTASIPSEQSSTANPGSSM